MDAQFKVGDLVRKHSDYLFPGTVVSVFSTRSGATRYVVEADHPEFAGLLHIFTEDQLVLREAEAAGRPLTPR